MIFCFSPGKAVRGDVMLIVLLLLTTVGWGQTISDTISVERGNYFYHGISLSTSQMQTLVRDNPLAFREMRKAFLYDTGSSFFAIIGGTGVGASLGQAISGEDPEWSIGLGIGAVGIGVALLLQRGFRKHAARAVEHYNNGLADRRPGLSFYGSSRGVGLSYSF